jgi:hypothetical protein
MTHLALVGFCSNNAPPPSLGLVELLQQLQTCGSHAIEVGFKCASFSSPGAIVPLLDAPPSSPALICASFSRTPHAVMLRAKRIDVPVRKTFGDVQSAHTSPEDVRSIAELPLGMPTLQQVEKQLRGAQATVQATQTLIDHLQQQKIAQQGEVQRLTTAHTHLAWMASKWKPPHDGAKAPPAIQLWHPPPPVPPPHRPPGGIADDKFWSTIHPVVFANIFSSCFGPLSVIATHSLYAGLKPHRFAQTGSSS